LELSKIFKKIYFNKIIFRNALKAEMGKDELELKIEELRKKKIYLSNRV